MTEKTKFILHDVLQCENIAAGEKGMHDIPALSSNDRVAESEGGKILIESGVEDRILEGF